MSKLKLRHSGLDLCCIGPIFRPILSDYQVFIYCKFHKGCKLQLAISFVIIKLISVNKIQSMTSIHDQRRWDKYVFKIFYNFIRKQLFKSRLSRFYFQPNNTFGYFKNCLVRIIKFSKCM